MSLTEDIRTLVGCETDDAPETLETYSRDASMFVVRPQVVVRPKDVQEIERLVGFVSKKKLSGESVSITPRAGGTDMSGGPLGESIILDTRYLSHFLELGESYAVTEPGVYFRDFDAETKKKNLELPSYPASRAICTVGGMVANDAGGEKNLKYGKTARYVEELDMVCSDGRVHTFKDLKGDVLSQKLSEQSFEGDLYRSVASLVARNRNVIEEGKPHVEKNSSGYALWDIGNGTDSLNLARLIVGSQGALGVITKIKFHLIQPKPCASMVVLFLKDIADLKHIIPLVLKHAPDSFESYDDNTFRLAVKYFPELKKQMSQNGEPPFNGVFGMLRLLFAFLPEFWMLARGGVPKLVLMVEFRDVTEEESQTSAKSLLHALSAISFKGRTNLIQNERGTRKYWAIRRESFNLLRSKVRGMRTAPFIEDFVVPPLSLPEFLPKLTAILSKYSLIYTVAGHVGDGNFHIIPLIDPKRKDGVALVNALSQEVYDLVFSFKGSISGEHNDGLVRTPYVQQMFGPKLFSLFEEVELIFDPQGIFNPGKKVGTNLVESGKRLDLPHEATL